MEPLDRELYRNLPETPASQWLLPPPCLAPEAQPYCFRFRTLVHHIVAARFQAAELPYTVERIVIEHPISCRSQTPCRYLVFFSLAGNMTLARDGKTASRDFLAVTPANIIKVESITGHRMLPEHENDTIQELMAVEYKCKCVHNRRSDGYAPVPVNVPYVYVPQNLQ